MENHPAGGKKSRRILLFFIVYGAMFLFGFIENSRGVSYPLIKAEFNASYEQQGFMVSALSVCYVCFCAVGGFCIARFGVKRAMLAGFLCIMAGQGAVFFMPGFWSAGAALLGLFAGFGLFEVGINALGTQIFTRRAALLMNLMHFFYGLGSVAGPRAAGLITGSLDWRYIYLLSLPLTLCFFIPALVTRFPGAEDSPDHSTADPRAAVKAEQVSFGRALKTPMVWLFALALGMMVVLEMASSNWGSLYFQDVYGMDPRTSGAAFMSRFFILFTLSRLLSGFLVEKIGYMRSLYGSVIGATVILILGFCLGPRGFFVLPVLGFFIAIFWPTTIAIAMGYFGRQAPVMTSAIIVIGGALNSVFQLLIGFINRFTGPAWGYRSCALYALILAAILVPLARRIAKKT